jgi:hypothetical protein
MREDGVGPLLRVGPPRRDRLSGVGKSRRDFYSGVAKSRRDFYSGVAKSRRDLYSGHGVTGLRRGANVNCQPARIVGQLAR